MPENGNHKRRVVLSTATIRTEFLAYWADQVMEASREVTGFTSYFVSDGAHLFEKDEKKLDRISEILGVTVRYGDLIVDVAQRLKDKFA